MSRQTIDNGAEKVSPMVTLTYFMHCLGHETGRQDPNRLEVSLNLGDRLENIGRP